MSNTNSKIQTALRATSGLIVCAAVLSTGCTTIGADNTPLRESMDFGPSVDVDICVLTDDGVDVEKAVGLLEAWNEKDGTFYDLYVRPVSIDTHPRGGFTYLGIMSDLKELPLPSHCDRLMFFVGRDWKDTAAWVATLPLPVSFSVGGAVSDTGTHGFVVAELGDPDAMFRELYSGRRKTTIHELYHMFGCVHAATKDDCYGQIQRLKSEHQRLLDPNADKPRDALTFPTIQLSTGELIVSRAEVASILEDTVVGDSPPEEVKQAAAPSSNTEN